MLIWEIFYSYQVGQNMVVRFKCKCGKSLKAPDEYIGKKVSCSKCDQVMRVPEKEDSLSESEEKPKKRVPKKQLQEFTLPPLSEVRKPEEVMAESSSSTPSSVIVEDSACSNIAQQMLKKKSSHKTNDPYQSGHGDSASTASKPEKQSGISKWMKENKHAAEAIKYNARLIIPGAAVVVVVCLGLYWIMTAMVGTTEHPPLEQISGIVTLDDKPLPHAEVVFVPQDEWKEDKIPAQSEGFTDDQGHFELSYLKGLKGAAMGTHVVRIFSTETQIPIIYNVKSILTYDVKGSDSHAEFKLVSR
ncbi:hypothetical protein Enr10x_32840 [Gimesia panareensis]|uniref:Uncharacterized protein n=2 Tax=Gimesia panareensis TaxID=2527978 RepID=A0A518A7Y6_9PLAN|nr:hypothetical protein Enr10x_32840 [Gimesia panareensis]QDU50815.1 hypothetical protein Pan110_31750 [Gimesia panareensis]